MANNNRYKEMETILTALLLSCTVIFVLYLIVAGAGIVWLKVMTSVLIFLISVGSLAFLYMTKELLRQRSLWMTSGFFSLILCTLVSLILAFPG